MHQFRELLPKTIYIDFVGKRMFFAGLSGIAVLVSIVLFVVIGPNWSIDFTGGTEVEVDFQDQVEIAEVRGALAKIGVGDDAIQQVGKDPDSRYLVRIQGASGASAEEVELAKGALSKAFGADWIEEWRMDAEVGTRAAVLYKGDPVPLNRVDDALKGIPDIVVQGSPEENTFYVRLPGVAETIRETLSTGLAGRPFEVLRTDSVGPKVGGNLREAGLISASVTMLLLLVYVAFRFDFAFAPGAILCLFHDAVIVCGIWVVTRQEFGLSMISAILTLVGYSINDTIVIYDRIRENMEKYRQNDLPKLINDTINQMLSRTVATSLATALALVPFLIWGGPILRQFASAMLLGIVIGSYSTIYVASPLMIILKENQDRILRLVGFSPKAASSAAPKGPKAP